MVPRTYGRSSISAAIANGHMVVSPPPPRQCDARVIHVKQARTAYLYIGRENGRYRLKRSKWHNPFKLGVDGDRDECLAKYRAYVLGKPELMAALHELDGQILGCWCAPQKCHGDVLLALRAEQLAVTSAAVFGFLARWWLDHPDLLYLAVCGDDAPTPKPPKLQIVKGNPHLAPMVLDRASLSEWGRAFLVAHNAHPGSPAMQLLINKGAPMQTAKDSEHTERIAA